MHLFSSLNLPRANNEVSQLEVNNSVSKAFIIALCSENLGFNSLAMILVYCYLIFDAYICYLSPFHIA